MFTLREIVSNQVTLLNETQLVELDGINAISITIKYDEKKVVKAHVGLYSYLFSRSFKNLVRAKVMKDLGYEFIFKFAI